MASSDDFRQQLKAGNITEALTLALSEAVELKFTTWVASGDDVEANPSQPGNRLRTRINTIEGEIEHEIGEEFIGTGRYRELRQFHLEQVAEGSKIVQNNLKSLQKLFEVLVALRYPDAQQTPVIETESLAVEPQVLPPTEDVPDAGVVVEPSELVVTDSRVGPEIVVEEEVPDKGLSVEPPEAVVADAVVSPEPPTEEAIIPLPLSPSEASQASPTTPTQEPAQGWEEEIEEDEDDWDDSVLELLESLPVEPPPTSEMSDSDLREDWGWEDLVDEDSQSEGEASDLQQNQDWENLRREDFDSPPASSEQQLETATDDMDEDWGDLINDESQSDWNASDLQENQNWENLRREDFDSPSAEQQSEMVTDMDEDWGDLIDDEPQSDFKKPIPSLDSLDLEEDDEWDDWVTEEPEPLLDTPVMDMEALGLDEDDDWGDLVDDAETLTSPPTVDKPTSNLDINEDWDDFTGEQVQSSMEFDTSPPWEDLIRDDAAQHQTQNINFSQDWELESSTDLEEIDRLSQMSQRTESSQDREGNSMDLLFEDIEPSEISSDSVIPEQIEVSSLEEVWFDEMSDDSVTLNESSQDVSEAQSDSRKEVQEKVDSQRKSTGKKVPPPPPPSHSPRPE